MVLRTHKTLENTKKKNTLPNNPHIHPMKNLLLHLQLSLQVLQWPHQPSHSSQNWSESKSFTILKDCLRRSRKRMMLLHQKEKEIIRLCFASFQKSQHIIRIYHLIFAVNEHNTRGSTISNPKTLRTLTSLLLKDFPVTNLQQEINKHFVPFLAISPNFSHAFADEFVNDD